MALLPMKCFGNLRIHFQGNTGTDHVTGGSEHVAVNVETDGFYRKQTPFPLHNKNKDRTAVVQGVYEYVCESFESVPDRTWAEYATCCGLFERLL